MRARVLALALALACPTWAGAADSARTTYRRRLVNHLSRVVVYYRYDREASRWTDARVVWPGLAVEERVPRRSGAPDLWGADIGGDGDIDLTRNDFGTWDWTWRVGENIPR